MAYRLIIIAVIFLFAVACSDDEVSGADLCPDGECVSCEDHGDCDDQTYCHEDGVCAVQQCEPHSGQCDGSAVTVCDQWGSGYGAPQTCPSGSCASGGCTCSNDTECLDGQVCSDDTCVSESQVACGSGGTNCPDGEVCAVTEVCDDDGSCEEFRECRLDCDGEVCGFRGGICCSGDNPICGPHGECAPDCSGGGELCGDDFDQCCADGEACIFGECRTLGDDCEHFTECPVGHYCDEGLGACLPDDFPDDLVCEDEYDFGDIEPQILWHWTGVEIEGENWMQVMMTPLVADMTGDGTPNVIVNAYGPSGGDSIPVVIDGATGETSHYYDHRHTNFGAQLAAVDITGNGVPEIVAVEHEDRGIGVIENYVDCPDPENDPEGCYLWWNDQDVETHQGAPVVGDLNGNGNVEIVLRDAILDGLTGELIARLPSGGYDYTVAVDVTGDGKLEILGVDCLYTLDEANDLDVLWCNEGALLSEDRRFAAAGDLTDRDGRGGMPELVLVGEGEVYVIAADDGEVIHVFDLPGGGHGGSPIVADFDGDGTAEIGVAGAVCYTVFDLDCVVPDGEGPEALTEDRPGCQRPQIETCQFGHHCACEDLADTGGTGDGILWSIYVQDESSHRTGSSVFDFQGNGRNEVVYNDECLLMVLDGQTGAPYFLHGNTNRTSSEYPIVVDVNGDNRTNIVVSANNDEFERDCVDPISDRPERFPWCHPEDPDDPVPTWCTEGTNGVVALQDPEDRWVRTRSIWNQFDYYIDNATDSAGVPTSPPMPWESHNTFRANRQGEVPLNAPDVVLSSVQVNALECPTHVYFRVTIENQGAAAIPAGLPVSLYLLEGGDTTLVATETFGSPISPGGVVTLELDYEVSMSQINQELDFMVVANDDGQGGHPSRDCNPDNTSTLIEDVVCSVAI